MGFIPISIEKYLKIHLENNPYEWVGFEKKIK